MMMMNIVACVDFEYFMFLFNAGYDRLSVPCYYRSNPCPADRYVLNSFIYMQQLIDETFIQVFDDNSIILNNILISINNLPAVYLPVTPSHSRYAVHKRLYIILLINCQVATCAYGNQNRR